VFFKESEITEAPAVVACCVLQLLVKWWSDYPAELLERRVVAPMQAYLTKELMATKKLTIGVMNAIKVRQTGGCGDAVQAQAACSGAACAPTACGHLWYHLPACPIVCYGAVQLCWVGVLGTAGRRTDRTSSPVAALLLLLLCMLQVLAKVEEANQVGRRLPPDGFYNQLIRWVPECCSSNAAMLC
jgi:hypothetical protein